MCDFSLNAVKSRPARVGDKLITHNFGTGTHGFRCIDDEARAEDSTAVCVLPGTELAFDEPVKQSRFLMGSAKFAKVAIFRQLNKDRDRVHHDALEFPDGSTSLLTYIDDNQRATVLQLPAAPKTEAEAKEQQRLEVVG